MTCSKKNCAGRQISTAFFNVRSHARGIVPSVLAFVLHKLDYIAYQTPFEIFKLTRWSWGAQICYILVNRLGFFLTPRVEFLSLICSIFLWTSIISERCGQLFCGSLPRFRSACHLFRLLALLKNIRQNKFRIELLSYKLNIRAID